MLDYRLPSPQTTNPDIVASKKLPSLVVASHRGATSLPPAFLLLPPASCLHALSLSLYVCLSCRIQQSRPMRWGGWASSAPSHNIHAGASIPRSFPQRVVYVPTWPGLFTQPPAPAPTQGEGINTRPLPPLPRLSSSSFFLHLPTSFKQPTLHNRHLFLYFLRTMALCTLSLTTLSPLPKGTSRHNTPFSLLFSYYPQSPPPCLS